MAELIRKEDTLNQGREKLNEAIKDADKAKNDSAEALDKAEEALGKSESTQTQLDTIVINGDSSVEAAQARVDEKGQTHTTLKERIDDGFTKVSTQLADKAPQKEVDNSRMESLVSRKKTKRPTITIVDDDGKKEFYTILFKLAKEFNVPITSAMITGFVDFPDYPTKYSFHRDYYTYEQIVEMRDSGLIEFISHSHDNISYRDSTDEEIREDIKQSQAILRHYGLNYRAIAVPFGHYDERVLGIIKDYFDYATGSATSIDEGKRIVAPPNVNNYRLGRLSGDGNRDFSTIEAGMDEAVAKNGGLVLTTHVMAGNGTDEEWIRRIITTALAKGLEFVTLEDCWKIHGNIAQFGGTNMQPSNIITSDGQIYGSQIGGVLFDHSTSITGTTPIHYFRKGAITYSRISGGRAGFPTSGMLETVYFDHLDSDLWNYQKFTTTREKDIYIRYWDIETEDWTDWELQRQVTLPNRNTYSLSTGHEEFPIGITYSIITTQDTDFSLAPEGQRGTLVTHKITESSQRSYNYQEYHAVDGTVYKRFAVNQTTWGNWFKYTGEPIS